MQQLSMISQKRKFQIYQHFTLLLILHMIKVTILNITYTGFEMASNHDSAQDNKESQGQFTDKSKFCMKMYCQDSSNQGSQHVFFVYVCLDRYGVTKCALSEICSPFVHYMLILIVYFVLHEDLLHNVNVSDIVKNLCMYGILFSI